MHKVIILGFPLVFVFLSAKVIGDEILRGKCERVLDGDTIEINKKRIRLWGIDAPEVSQKSFEGKEIGLISKAFLSQLIEGKEIKVVITHRGYYGRMIGKIYLGKQFINFEMIKSGQALIGRGVVRGKMLEHQARIKRRGMFATSGFHTPWYYRKLEKNFSANISSN